MRRLFFLLVLIVGAIIVIPQVAPQFPLALTIEVSFWTFVVGGLFHLFVIAPRRRQRCQGQPYPQQQYYPQQQHPQQMHHRRPARTQAGAQGLNPIQIEANVRGYIRHELKRQQQQGFLHSEATFDLVTTFVREKDLTPRITVGDWYDYQMDGQQQLLALIEQEYQKLA